MAMVKFNRELLDTTLQRDGATLVGEYDTFKRDSKIPFRCSCGVEYVKGFRLMYESGGAFCEKCTKTNRANKVKHNTLEKYGVEYSFQRIEIKEKSKATILERHGVEYAGQIQTGKEKARVTNLERYGVQYPMQNQDQKEKVRNHNLEVYGVVSTAQLDWVKEKAIVTNLEKYGTKYTHQSEDVKEKAKNTNLERYGVENPFQNDSCKEKSKSSCLKKYGVLFPMQNADVKNKANITNLERYGVECPLQNQDVKDRGKITNLKKYGVEHPSQNQEVMERTQKNAKKYKDFVMPSGDVRKIQGYEHFALRDLLSTYTEEQIITGCKNVPRIQYVGSAGKKRYHFPDIFIPHENKIVEVKSTWTYKCKADSVLQKREAAIKLGFLYEIWVYDEKGKRITQNL